VEDKEFNYLLSAAFVSKKFRDLLLADPLAAIQTGYDGRAFNLSPRLVEIISDIKVATLDEFARNVAARYDKLEIGQEG
jgi:hypothetical protein